MHARKVVFKNSRGQNLVGDFCEGDEPVGVIACHGMLSSRNGTKIQYLSSLLTEFGIPNLRFDFCGRGESDGMVEELSYSNQVEDLQGAIEFMVTQGMQRIALFGSSMGGSVALLAASRDERVVAISTIAAVAYPELLEDRYPRATHEWRKNGYLELEGATIGLNFLEDAKIHNVVSAVAVIQAPLMVIHGIQDATVPVCDAHDIASAANNVFLNIVDGADHRFSNTLHMRPAMKEVAEFLARELRGVEL